MGRSHEDVVEDDGQCMDCDDEEEGSCRDSNSAENHCDSPTLKGTGGVTQDELQAANDALETANRAVEDAVGNELRGRSLHETLLKVIEVIDTRIEARASAETKATILAAKLRAVSLTPYFPSEIRKEFQDAVTRLIDATQKSTSAIDQAARNEIDPPQAEPPQPLASGETCAHLKDTRRRLLDTLSGETKLKVAEHFLALEAATEKARREAAEAEREAEREVWKARREAAATLHDMKDNVVSTRHTLNFLAGMSQAESTITEEERGTETMDAISSLAKEAFEGIAIAGETPESVLSLYANKVAISPLQLFGADLTDDRRKSSYDNLNRLALAWEAWISKSKLIPVNDEAPNDKVMRGIDWILNHMKRSEGHMETTERPWFPNIRSGEVSAAQPAILWLLDQIGCCLEGCNAPSKRSPLKTQAKRNQMIPQSTRRKKRIADIGVLKPGRFQLVLLDCATKLLVEVKPVLRKKMSPDKLDEESLQQTIGHLSKHVFPCLNFFGHGLSSTAIGLTVTLTHVKVVQLTLTLKEFSPETRTMA
eukprot:CAMPEP_0117054794 /NCGR_PEP_ID=MMETSP0472-20121206/37974_1 /TAXON_ID=693140 ORGANISM="Tiarina fusus, Strain LIS" /NCGR_SAMPLE_ID=MMETSP0472 /ASSEMBLY_ACC=CAM_ASM_000603 /LENGTH=538 /DNA_ID=CAMNT_0004770519 /DNA_START=124 /DNA_END=1736 /DNA_ORIENTATION=+